MFIYRNETSKQRNAIVILSTRFVNNKIIRQKDLYRSSKNDFRKSDLRKQNKIRVLFVNITIDDNVFVINFKLDFFKMYRVLFIKIKISKHKYHDTRKLFTLWGYGMCVRED